MADASSDAETLASPKSKSRTSKGMTAASPSPNSIRPAHHPRHTRTVSARVILTPPPTGTQSDLTARLDSFSMNSPVAGAHSNIASPSPPPQEQSFFARNRAILMSGLSQSPEAPDKPGKTGKMASGQENNTFRAAASRRLAPLVIQSSGTAQQHLAKPSSPMQSPRILSPCIYVKATNLRRPSASTASCSSSINNGSDTDARSASYEHSASDGRLTPPPDGKINVCAFVRPSTNENAFAIHRTFDRQELLKAVPKAEGRPASNVNILPPPMVRSPLSALPSLNAAASPVGPVAGVKRPASPLLSPTSQLNRHRHVRQRGQKDLPSPDRFLSNGAIPIPIHPHPDLGALPGLAAVILSGHVKPGDTVELPLPHPEAWQQTVSHVYNGRGELSEEVQRNIDHLGGELD